MEFGTPFKVLVDQEDKTAPDRKQADCTPQVPQILLLPMTERVAVISRPATTNETDQEEYLIQGIHEAVHRLVHHRGAMSGEGRPELHYSNEAVTDNGIKDGLFRTRGHVSSAFFVIVKHSGPLDHGPVRIEE